MSNFAMCPHCNCELNNDYCFDIELDDRKIISHWRGPCPKCGKNFRWKEIYLFDRIENLVEDNN